MQTPINLSEDEYRQAIVDEAMSWLRTPYIHLGDIKGVGTDCAMLLIRVYQKAVPHIVPADFDPRPYEPEWFLHRDEELYMAGMEKYSHRIETPKIGDIALYRFGRTASHGAIIVADGMILHAYREHGNVGLMEMRALVDKSGVSRLDSYWSVF